MKKILGIIAVLALTAASTFALDLGEIQGTWQKFPVESNKILDTIEQLCYCDGALVLLMEPPFRHSPLYHTAQGCQCAHWHRS